MKLGVIIAAAILLSVLALVFGCYGYPVKSINDASAYLVPALQMARVGELANPITWTSIQSFHSGPFLVEPPLFQILLASLMSPAIGTPLPIQAFIAISAINVATIIFSAWVLYLVAAAGGRKLGWLETIITCASLFLILRASWSFGGRPETLMRLFFTGGLLLALKVRRSGYLAVILGTLLGAIAATHVSAPVFFAAIIGFVFAVKSDSNKNLLESFFGNGGEKVVPPKLSEERLRRPLKVWSVGSWKSFQYALLAAGIGVLTFVVLMQLSPYSITATYKAILKQAEVTAPLTLAPGRNILGIFRSSYAFLYAVFGVLLAFFAARIFLRAVRKGLVASPLLVVLSAAAAAMLVFFVLINGFRMYHIAPFLLLLMAAFIYYIAHIAGGKLTRYATTFLFAGIVLVSLKHVALFPSFLRDGKTLPVARAEVARVLEKGPGVPIKLGGPRMWALSEDYSRMVEGDLPEGSGRYLYLQEEESYPELLPELDTCKLSENFYTDKVPKLFGIALGPATPGYGFAVYECRW